MTSAPAETEGDRPATDLAPEPEAAGVDAIDRLLGAAGVILVAGPGGVGKTTVTAALGVRAARHHARRVVVVTVDPARRLADALGVSRLTEEPILVPVGEGAGRLWVVMVDMARSWDHLVDRHAPDAEVRDRLLANGLYRTLTRRFVQSHDYIALDHLCDLVEADRYDLVIVDTPPSTHALDLFDAPGRMIEFFRSRLLRWLIAGSGAGLASAPARPFLLLAERLLGRGFLTEIAAFFGLFAELRPAFVARAEEVERRLTDPATIYAVVTTTEAGPIGETGQLLDALAARTLTPGLVVVNRFEPTLQLRRAGGPTAGAGRVSFAPRFTADEVAGVESASLRAAMAEMQARAESAGRAGWAVDCPVIALPWRAGDLDDLDELAELLVDAMAAEEGSGDRRPSGRPPVRR